MKNLTTTLSKALIIVSASLVFSMSAQAAGYLKIGDIKGESQRSEQSSSHQQSAPKKFSKSSKPQRALLLPAVQSVRESARPSSPQKDTRPSDHSAGGEHEITYDIAAGV